MLFIAVSNNYNNKIKEKNQAFQAIDIFEMICYNKNIEKR